MPFRKTLFVNNQYYHVLNRGVADSIIFNNVYDYQRFSHLIRFYRYKNPPLSFSKYNKLPLEQRVEFAKSLQEKGKPQVELYSYCLMPNHFHFLLKQTLDYGIQKFLTNLQNGYAKYYNIKLKRFGPLFQSRFKAKIILTDEVFLHVSRYIHLNPTSSYLASMKELPSYTWSSLPEYFKTSDTSFLNTNFILKMVGGKKEYKKFIYNQVDYQRKLQRIKHILLEK